MGVVSPACTGDFAGDGAMELAWSHDNELIGVELDGTPLWTVTRPRHLRRRELLRVRLQRRR